MYCAISKIVLFILNLIILGCGIAMVVAAFINKLLSNEIDANVVPTATMTCFVMLGGMMIAMGAMGCMADIIAINLVTRVYAVGLMIVALMLLGFSVYGLLRGLTATDQLIQEQRSVMDEMVKRNDSRMDKIQRTFQCCGVIKADEWTHHYQYPLSCCPPEKVYNHKCALRDIYNGGCKEKVSESYHRILKIVFFMTMLFSGICMVTGAVFLARTCA